MHGRVPGLPYQENAKLLSIDNGIVLQYPDRIETEVVGRIVFPKLPEGLRDRPTLILDIDEASAGAQDLDLTYITGGLSWRADYVGSVSPNEKRLDLSGFVTLTNDSGTSFPNAHLQLVGGNVNMSLKAGAGIATQLGRLPRACSGAFVQPQFQEQSYFEYHLYTLGRTTSVLNNQTKQVSLLNARNIPLHKTLEMRGGPESTNNAKTPISASM